MSADEQLDVVQATGTPIGTRARNEVHREGLWHQVFHGLIVRSGQPATVVLQRRQPTKAFPNKLDLSATGHLVAGERPLDGIRELQEELGIRDVTADALVPLGVRLLADDSGEGVNRERAHAFLLNDDRPLDQFAPDPAEVTSLVEAKADDLLRILGDENATATATEWVPGHAPATATIVKDDLVNPVDGYWVVILVMAGRFAAGQRPLAV